MIFAKADVDGRRKLLWLCPLILFAFVVPVHLILLAIGVPPFLPRGFAPP
jgi:hypothetical protein